MEKYSVPNGSWGEAINFTMIDEKGEMWCGNGEYSSRVNFCPITGKPAPKQMVVIDEWDIDGDGIKTKQYGDEKTI